MTFESKWTTVVKSQLRWLDFSPRQLQPKCPESCSLRLGSYLCSSFCVRGSGHKSKTTHVFEAVAVQHEERSCAWGCLLLALDFEALSLLLVCPMWCCLSSDWGERQVRHWTKGSPWSTCRPAGKLYRLVSRHTRNIVAVSFICRIFALVNGENTLAPPDGVVGLASPIAVGLASPISVVDLVPPVEAVRFWSWMTATHAIVRHTMSQDANARKTCIKWTWDIHSTF